MELKEFTYEEVEKVGLDFQPTHGAESVLPA
jgi:hypothetical protein